MVLSPEEHDAVGHLLALAKRVSEFDLTCPIYVMEIAADELTFEKTQVCDLLEKGGHKL